MGKVNLAGRSVDELERLWERRRKEIADTGDRKALDELFLIRREIERRRGWKRPTTEVNFERDYITD